MNDNIKHEFKGTVKKVIYNGEDFKVFAIDVDKKQYPEVHFNKYGNVSISGDLPMLTIDSEYDFVGEPQTTKYGMGYKVVSVRQDLPTTEEGVRKFLSSILTKNQAATIMESYPNIVTLVKENKQDTVDLSKLKGIGEKKFVKIVNKIIENYCLMDLVTEFKDVLSISMLKKIYEKYPSIDKLKQRLKNNPYTTLTTISRIGFKTADAIVLQLQEEGVIEFDFDIKTSLDRCMSCTLYILEENENQGHTKMNLQELRKQCLKTVPECIDKFPDVLKSGEVYYNTKTMDAALKRTYETEKEIADMISNGIHNNANIWDINTDEFKNVGNFELTDEQIRILDVVCKNNISILNGFAGCVDCDTEFFNGTQWKKISDYNDEDMVLQYNQNGTAKLVKPSKYIKQPADYLWHFKTKYGLDQCLSDNHNVYYITSKGNLYHKTFKEVREDQEKNGFHGKFITTFDYSGSGIDLSDDEIRLMVATFADGSFYKKCKDNHNAKSYLKARFHIKKERKKERLLLLAQKANCEYSLSDSAAEGYTDIYVTTPFRAKHFPKEWYNCNKSQLQVIADEVMFWDGDYKKNNCFCTCYKEDADFIQFVFSSLGYRATILVNSRVGREYKTNEKMYNRKSVEYVVAYTERTLVGLCTDNRPDHTKTKIEQYKTVDGYQYCFTVPSHMLVLRRNNKIFITGNSGKSASTQGLIQMLKKYHKTFLLLAPTGKAAKVLHENTKEKASTIHRGLGYMPKAKKSEERWLYNRNNQFFYDIVVVDEFSMVDIWLFKHLIDAIDFSRTKLLLIGDNAQLPSVACGNLLHDFMEANIIPTVTLNKIFRYSGGGLMKVATDTRCCKPYLTSAMKGLMTPFGDSKDYVFIDKPDEKIGLYTVKLYEKLLQKGEKVEDIQVLTAKNVGECGSVELNNEIQKVANPNFEKTDCMKIGETSYYKGDLVLQVINNYEADVYNPQDDEKKLVFVANGESGIIKDINADGVIIDFGNVTVIYTKEQMNMVKLGYAISIHKSQGGGFKNVILCTPQKHIFMLDSNLLYVGITRTTKNCYHIGNTFTSQSAIRKKSNLKRDTFIQQLLKLNVDK